MKRLLIIDDEENMRHMLSVLLAREDYEIYLAADGRQGLAALDKARPDIILCDIKMPVMDGLQFLEKMREKNISVPVVMMSAFGTVRLAVDAMKNGAVDFISKPFQGEEIIMALNKALEQQALRRENRELKEKLARFSPQGGFDALIGESRSLRRVIDQAAKIARYKTTVLITGESGTGKELLARGIHMASDRHGRPFVAVNCGSIPENLMESEFFGYVRGAFTGADSDRKGLFDEARGGTLFLDEIGELPLAMQVKLLRVLQENEFRPVGGRKSRNSDVRIIAATARDLEKMVAEKTFRQDLFFRLNVVHLSLPPLRERVGDIVSLAEFFINKINKKSGTSVRRLSPAAVQRLMEYNWPGNVRELENIIERSVLFAESGILHPEDLPEKINNPTPQRRLDDLLGSISLKKGRRILEKRLIGRALEKTEGNKRQAAEILEISYPSLLSKIKQYDL